MDGVIVVDKPADWTSHDVVNKMRRIAGTKKVGHLGTLDPIATGVLPLVIGRATRLAQFYVRSDKMYDALVRFGWSTNTYDCAGEATSEKMSVTLDPSEVDRLLDRFRGEFLQTPPPVSAKKVGGQRAYKLARQRIPVDLEPVSVHVYELKLVECSGAEARLEAHCSGGTYLRSIAHDLGQALGCGAHLQSLRRTASGEFDIEHARTLEQIACLAAGNRLPECLVPPHLLLPGLPTVFVDELTSTSIRRGCNFPASPFRSEPAARQVKAVTSRGELVAIGEAVLPNLYHPVVVL
ncbi:MAG: tRNA pseudouridine(55) synthase TruB [Acidobacteriia bacterium]|nr:tRNA pseudouridine(55) synthase TruB [Terriglobia bacterium]